jgi:hypothetical protein
VMMAIAFFLIIRRAESRLTDMAERALPGTAREDPVRAQTSDAFNRGEPSLRPFRLDGDDKLRRLDRPD